MIHIKQDVNNETIVEVHEKIVDNKIPAVNVNVISE